MRVLVYGMVGTNRGGIETFLLKMNQYMNKETIFDYVIEGKTCIHEKEINAQGGKIYYITKRTESPIKNIWENKKLLKKLKSQIDAVYFNLSSLCWVISVKFAVAMGYRVFVHAHNAEFVDANSDLFHRIVNAYNKKMFSSYNITRLTCSNLATKFMFNTDDKVEMIYNAILPSHFTFNIFDRERIRAELKIKNEQIIGYVGRLNNEKNPLFLPDIMQSILKRRSDIKMIILGDGCLRKNLKRKIANMRLQDNCLVLGNKTNVNEYMQAMDVMVLPSWNEGLPYAVVEAQTAGLRCVISDSITKEVDVTGNITFLSLSKDADDWGKVICTELEANYNDREYWGEFMSKTHFNIKNEALRLERILSNCI